MPFCKSCSAPLPPYNGRCEYCGVKNDINLQGIHEFTVARPVTKRPCPICKTPMETIDIKSSGHFFIERCSTCMGLFFDPGELNALLDKSVDNVYRIDLNSLWSMNQIKNQPASRTLAYINCPVCGKLMNRTSFGARSGVVVDTCKHGIWLDNGELRKLLEWRKAGGQLYHEKLLKERGERENKKRRQQTHAYRPGGTPGSFTYTSPSDYYNTEISLNPLLAGAAKAIWRLFT